MAVYEQPTFDKWKLRDWPAGPPDAVRAARQEMLAAAGENARRLGTGSPDASQIARIIGTGHQAWLWHPGILAKDVRTWRLAEKAAPATVIHVVVDHDVHAALTLELPVISDERLSVRTVKLADEKPDVPSGCQPPVSGEAVAKRAEAIVAEFGDSLPRDVASGLLRLSAAFREVEKAGGIETLAEQVTAVTWALARGSAWAKNTGVVFGTELHRSPCFGTFVGALLKDAEWAVVRYNEATRLFPGAGIGELRIERDRVELPLWWLAWNQPRKRVFADLSDSVPALVLEDGTELAWQSGMSRAGFLAPRALSLTAIFRGWLCDGFVHGKGGGIYDRITETWWNIWAGANVIGVALAPMAVASADVRMKFDVPVADRDERLHAIWRQRWLEYNVDVAMDEPSERKHELVEEMEHIAPGSGIDRAERREVRKRNAERFREIRAITAAMREAHPELLEEAAKEVERTTIGDLNRATALKRDWFWGLYSPRELAELG